MYQLELGSTGLNFDGLKFSAMTFVCCNDSLFFMREENYTYLENRKKYLECS